MIWSSVSNGTFSRLGRRERLGATSSCHQSTSTQPPKKKKEKAKAFEFVLVDVREDKEIINWSLTEDTAPTRDNNTLDLVLTNIPNKVKICEILSPTQAELFTDHNIIVFEISMCYSQLLKIRRTVYNYHQGDFAGLQTSLECLNLDSLITTDENIDHDWQQWKKAFLQAVSQHIPSVRVKGRNYVPWMNSTILHNIKKKNSIRLRIKKSPTPTQYLQEKFKTLRSSIKSMLHNNHSKYFDSICSSRGLNPKRFWSLFKFNNKTRIIPQ
jgi:chaperonin cofactor prefoldin